MNRRLRIVKSILWAIVGVWAVVTVVRFSNGLGATTDLSDATPWGLWIAFDVMAGVALAAGGFVIAAAVYIFGLERYRRFVRPAILTAFLGYIAVAVGLLYDLGLPWHIWHPVVFPQLESVLFEVAMCVMLYLTVLALEFAPVVLEHPLFDRPFLRRILAFLTRATLVFVIAGIVLSTLHQSSLGSLFLIAPYRLDPLWYTPIIYILFFVSAVGLGLMTVMMESVVSGWLFGHKARTDLLSGLGLAAGVVLGFYAVLRTGDAAARGVFGQAFDGSWLGFLFLFELLVCAALPAVLLAMRRVRTSLGGLGVCAGMVIFGMVLNRLSVCILAFERPDGVSYFPTWQEIAVSLGIVAAGTLAFLFFVEKLKVYPEEETEMENRPEWRPSYDPATLHSLTPESVAAPRRYSLAAVIAAGIAVAFLPRDAVFGPQPVSTPVSGVRTTEGVLVNPDGGTRARYVLVSHAEDASPESQAVALMIIDGNRDGRLVLFPHEGHVEELGGDDSCARCHHMNMPLDSNSACSECHRDMYEQTDIFDHASHVAHLNGNTGCSECHTDSSRPKSRETATACDACHADMPASQSFLGRRQETPTGRAPSYMNAMHDLETRNDPEATHGLCLDCHEKKVAEDPDKYPREFAQCAHCHDRSADVDLRQTGPYRPRRSKAPTVADVVRAAPSKGKRHIAKIAQAQGDGR